MTLTLVFLRFIGEKYEDGIEDLRKTLIGQALDILWEMNESRESFRKIGLTFEEKAFYDILLSLCDQYNLQTK